LQIENNTTLLDQFGWVFRARSLSERPQQALLLLHGWTGDENSMWAFAKNFSPQYAILAPRAPFLAPKEKGGYSWRDLKPGTWGKPTLDELRPPADGLVSLVDGWLAALNIPDARFDVAGFSQGGALATLLAILYPQRIRKLAVLAGFVPKGVDDAQLTPGLLSGIDCFWAHGTQDDLVTFERGRESAQRLEAAGAQVRFCEADVGHRVSRECRHALDAFLAA
jgi:phospholipase/carboxylesterase